MHRFIAAFSGVILSAAAPAAAQSSTSDTIRLSIEEAVATGLKVADEVRLSAAQAEMADAQFNAARAGLVPLLRLTSTFGRTFESARSAAVNPVFAQTNAYTINASVSQPLFQGGKLIATARAAGSLAAASRLSAQEQRAFFTVTVQRAYLNALLAERLVELQESNLQLASTRLTQVQQFQTAGRAAQYDVLRAKVERANIEPLTIQARNDRELAQLEVKRLLNLSLERPIVFTSVIDVQATEVMVASYMDPAALPQRAALRSAELVSRSRHLAITAARADLLPTISVFFNTGVGAFPTAGYGIPSGRGTLGNSFCPVGSPATKTCNNGGWFDDRNMGVQFSWALFDGLRAKSALEMARAQTRIADLELRQEREQVALEVAKARAELRRAKAVFDGRRETSSEAQEAFRLASLRFSRGLSTQLEVSDSQLALLTAEGSEARATYDLYLATAELARSLGKPIPLPATRAPARRTSDE